MILLIDNYDSFSYNLYQLIGEINPDIRVIRNDEMSIEEIRKLNPERIILSPGPGRPEDAGVTVEAVKALGKDIPILGVCLGHQAICQAFGATVTYAKELMHGKQSEVRFDTNSLLFRHCKEVGTVPLVFMTYANVVYSYGADKFFCICHEIGIDGIILPDLPFEEKDEFATICKKYGVALISMIAPTSDKRIAMIAKEAEGFLYLVSSLGVTGTRSEITTDLTSIVKVVREHANVPCAIGFGISTPKQAEKMAKIADGVIVGSAIVRQIGEYGREAVPVVAKYVKGMKEAVLR